MTRVAVAGLMYEANSFAPGMATVDDFRSRVFVEGPACFLVGRGDDEFAGALRAAGRAGIDLVPTTLALGAAGPVLTADAYRLLRDRLIDGLAPHVGTVEGIYLRLHGAMLAAGCDDPEGEILTAVRELAGPDLPIGVSLDLHAHFTPRMAAATPLFAAFRTHPHVDYAATGERAMALLAARLRGARPVLRFRKIPLMAAAESQDTATGPASAAFARLDEIARVDGVLEASLFMTQPWLDVPGLGWCAAVVTDGDADAAQRHADELATMLWECRENTLVHKTSIPDALSDVRANPPRSGPVVLTDGADSTTAGGKGDSTELLRALLADPVPGPVLTTVTDAAAAEACHAAGVGATVTVRLGGSLSPAFFAPIDVTGTVIGLCDGEFASRFPAQPAHAGRTAVLRVVEIDIVVTSAPVRLLDAELYRRAGLDVRRAAVVQVKSSGGFRATYSSIAERVITLDTRGPADHRLTALPYRRITRPCWPWDEDIDSPW